MTPKLSKKTNFGKADTQAAHRKHKNAKLS